MLDKLEAKDDTIKSQFSRFVLVGGVSTVINYALFYVLYAFFAVNYLVASATGYVIGALFGYYFNARITFRSRPGLSVIPYFAVYTFSLIASLGVLKFFAISLTINPLIANIVAIAFSTTTNFLGSRYIAFNEKFRLPPFFTSRIFLSVLALKLLFSFLFASDFMTKLFIPFVKYFVENPLANPYDHFFSLGLVKSFPYPPLMLFVVAAPFILLGGSAFFDLFAMRLSLLAADIVIFYVLYKIFRGKEIYTLMLYWASPVVFYITYVHGQLDIIPVALLFASTYFLIGKRYFISAALLGSALATKSFVLVAFPIYFIYLLKKGQTLSRMAGLFLVSAIVYAAFLLPYFSSGFIQMVFFAEEQFRLFNLSVPFTQSLIYYLVPAAYAYILFKAASFKKITRDILFVLLGLTLTLFVTFINPARGWYLWAIPFVVYFFIKERSNLWIYASFNAAYLLYFLFVPDSDVFNVFQVIAPGIAEKTTPYYFLISSGLPMNLAVNLLFTALTSTLIYTSYLIYKNGVKSSLLFQEKNGIPIIGISGDSGAGKTTAALSLADMFGWEKVTMVYGDDIHRWERDSVMWKEYTHLNPVGNKIYLNYNQIKKLKNGYAVKRPYYDHKTGKFRGPIAIKPKDFIISEGLHTFFINESNDVYELKVYMDPDPSLRTLWKVRRDVNMRGHLLKDVLKQLKKREPDSKRFISPQKYYSDVIISYMPTEKIDFSDISRDVPILTKIDIKNDIPVEDFVEALSQHKDLNISLLYPDHRFQRLLIEGGISKEDLKKVLTSLDIDYESYEITWPGIKDDIAGVVQVLLLYCLNERLKKLSGAEDYE